MKRLVLGITGGVGSGKSTVLNYLQNEMGALVIQADLVARELMEPGESCYEAVVHEFGREILAEDGTIDRPALAALIFKDEAGRKRINELTHPLVRREVELRIALAEEALVVYESAIPREACMGELCHEIWFVHVPVETRIRRLMESRGYTREKCLAIMESQLSDREFTDMSDRVIENGGTPEETIAQVKRFLVNEDTTARVEEAAAEAGFCEIKIVPSGRVCFEPNVRTLCERECETEGITSYSLPPMVGTYDDCRRRCLEHPYALLLSAIFPTEDIAIFSAWMEAGQEMNRMINELCRTLQEEGMELLPLGMRCRRCEICACPESPCRNPETLLPATEAYGIHIMNTMEQENITGYYDGQTIVCFGVAFFG